MDAERLDALRSAARDAISSDEHGEALEVICDANGWTREEFIMGRHEFQSIELFLLQFQTIPQLKFFPNLVTLKLHHIGLTEIRHMETLVHLEVLWLSENDIQRIEGLENCEGLRELYLQNNQIRRMEGLKRLKQLQVLWLCRNQICAIEETEHLPKLRSLWLAGNHISTLRNAFPGLLPMLQELNVASNNIASFRDIPVLNELKSLETVYFSDPLFGDNPVCQLSNYQTFTLFHLPQVRTLDYVHISAEQRLLAESTFVKKKIYYSMRIHTVRRNLSILLHAVNALANKKAMEASSSMAVLERLARNLEQDVEEFQTYGTTSAPDLSHRTEAVCDAARASLQRVRHAMASRRREMEVVEHKRSEACRCMGTLTETYISRLMLELNTGGNVRLEEGKTKEVWFQSCGELLRTRFFATDFEPFGIKDIQVNKVTRIHNRGLRSCFDQALGSLVDLSDPSYKRALEYLFYALPHASDAEVNDALEHGLGRPGSLPPSTQFSGVRGVPMTNSVFLAEQVRLQTAKASGALRVDDPNFSAEVFVGRIVVCKVFLGKCQGERSTRGGVAPPDGDVATQQQSLVLTPPVVSPNAPQSPRGSEYPPGTTSVYRCKPEDPKQRIWFCLSPELVLPEYVVEFTYTPSNTCAPTPPAADYGPHGTEDPTQHFRRVFPTTSAVDVADFKTIGIHCLSYLHWCETSPYSAMATRDAAEVLAAPISFSKRPVVGGELHDAHIEDYCTALCSASQQPVELSLLNLHSRKINALQISKSLMEATFGPLKELVLFDNDLTSFPWVDVASAAPLLDTLDLSHNQLQRLHDMAPAKLASLKTFYIDNNFLFNLDDAKSIALAAPNLSHLSIAQNPCMGEKRASWFLTATIPSLDMLSHTPIADQVELRLHRLTPKSLDGLVLGFLVPMADKLSNGTICSDTTLADPSRQFHCYDEAVKLYVAHRLANDGVAPAPSIATVSQIPPPQVLAINHSQLESLDRIDRLRRIVHLQLRGNHIADMEPLMALSYLETADLEDNRIRRITGLGAITRLRRLDLSKNLIERIENVDTLKSLQFLALSHNRISTLAPLASCSSSLLELYCSGNIIASEKEALHLRDLPKLIILDLAGNPCASIEAYRSYVVFQVKRLKVLDGISIDAAEIQRSRDTFAGRISAELLRERLPTGTDWSLARELNLASCALKEVTLLDTFATLTHLKLEHNQLVTIEGLRCCTSLVALNLSHNKLGQCTVGKVFESMPNLESLSLESNGITSIAFLQLNCPRLKFLNLKANEILKADGLDRVGQLREILLDKNRLRSIDRDALLFVPYLRELYCEENAIKTIDGVHVAVQLQKVSFASNRINEVSDLGKCLEGLPISDICFLGNPVVRKAYYRNHLIHSLPLAQIIDNRVVTAEERERVESSYQQDTIPPNVFTDVRMPMQGGSVVVPVPPSQKVPLKVLSLDAEGREFGGSGPSSGNLRGRPPQMMGGKGIVGVQSGSSSGGNGGGLGSAQRTSSADLRGNQVIPVNSGPRVSAPAPALGGYGKMGGSGGSGVGPSLLSQQPSFRKK